LCAGTAASAKANTAPAEAAHTYGFEPLLVTVLVVLSASATADAKAPVRRCVSRSLVLAFISSVLAAFVNNALIPKAQSGLSGHYSMGVKSPTFNRNAVMAPLEY